MDFHGRYEWERCRRRGNQSGQVWQRRSMGALAVAAAVGSDRDGLGADSSAGGGGCGGGVSRRWRRSGSGRRSACGAGAGGRGGRARGNRAVAVGLVPSTFKPGPVESLFGGGPRALPAPRRLTAAPGATTPNGVGHSSPLPRHASERRRRCAERPNGGAGLQGEVKDNRPANQVCLRSRRVRAQSARFVACTFLASCLVPELGPALRFRLGPLRPSHRRDPSRSSEVVAI